ncbi:MAG: hypothetical protein ACI9BW_000917 [Gammaproteobacteria bacterium]|jgi:hypothetical protein
MAYPSIGPFGARKYIEQTICADAFRTLGLAYGYNLA